MISIAKNLEEISTCDVIITNLSADEVVKDIYEKLARVLRVCCPSSQYPILSEFQLSPPVKNKIFVETSTVSSQSDFHFTQAETIRSYPRSLANSITSSLVSHTLISSAVLYSEGQTLPIRPNFYW